MLWNATECYEMLVGSSSRPRRPPASSAVGGLTALGGPSAVPTLPHLPVAGPSEERLWRRGGYRGATEGPSMGGAAEGPPKGKPLKTRGFFN